MYYLFLNILFTIEMHSCIVDVRLGSFINFIFKFDIYPWMNGELVVNEKQLDFGFCRKLLFPLS